MQRGSSNTTPIYFFSSVKPGSGKSSIVSNLAVYLTDLDYKVALLDLDNSDQNNICARFPSDYQIEQYSDLSSIVSTEDARFTQNFYFTKTKLLSYFPAKELDKPSILLTDTALHDFFLQLTNTFDIILVNLRSGMEQAKNVSDLLLKKYLWPGCSPLSVIISSGNENSLVELDTFIHNNQIVSYQAEENTYFVFNKIYNSADDQKTDDSNLTMLELRKLFTYPLTYIIPQIEEFAERKDTASSYIFQNDSELHSYIAGLFKVLTGSASLNALLREVNTYQSCISGELLDCVKPYMEKLQQRIADDLLIDTSDVQLFLEQNEHNYRIRVKLTSIGLKLIGVKTDIPDYQKLSAIADDFPKDFIIKSPRDKFTTITNQERETTYSLCFKSIFSFDDSFVSKPVTSVNKHIPLKPNRKKFPSPIIFPQRDRVAEIPTLANILGLEKQQKYYKLCDKTDEILAHGVKPFLIPTDFRFSFDLVSRFTSNYSCIQNFHQVKIGIVTEIKLPKANDYLTKKPDSYKIFDIFSRNKPFEFTTGFVPKLTSYHYKASNKITSKKHKLALSILISATPIKEFIETKFDIAPISDIITKSLKIIKPKTAIKFNKVQIENNEVISKMFSPNKYDLGLIPTAKSINFLKKEIEPIILELQNPLFSINRFFKRNKLNYQSKESFVREKVNCKSPKSYDHVLFKPNLRKQFREKEFKPLPAIFKLSDSLMDYGNPILAMKKPKLSYKANQNLSTKKKFKPEFITKFKQNYMEPNLQILRRATYSKPVMYQLFLSKRLVVESRATISYAEYKVGYNEIFPVIYFPQARFAYQIRKLKNTDLIGKENKESDKDIFKLIIPPIKATSISGSYETVSAEKKRHFKKCFESKANLLPAALLTHALPKPVLGKDFLKYDKLPLIGHNSQLKMSFEDTTKLNISDYKIRSKTLDTSVLPPNIFTDRIRVKQTNFQFKTWIQYSPELSVSKNLKILKYPFKVATVENHEYHYKGELRNIELPKAPLRTKALKLADNFSNLNGIKPVFEFTPTLNNETEIKFAKLDCQRLENQFIAKSPELLYAIPKITKNYILKKLAPKLPKPRLSKINFAIIPENPSEALYKHLLWKYRNTHCSTKCEYNDKLTCASKLENFSVVYNYSSAPSTIEFVDRTNLKHRMNKPIIRIPYKVKNNHIKDLLELARAKTKASLATLANLDI